MIIPVGYAQANLVFNGSGVPRGAQIALGLDNTGLSLSPENVAAAVIDCWSDNLRTVTATSVILASVRVKQGPNSTGPFAENTAALPGIAVGTAVDPQVAVLVRKRTGLGGRSNQGRMFLPGIVESYTTTGGLLTSGGITDIGAAVLGFAADLATADLPIVILHSSGSAAPVPITGLELENLVATQRRRIRRVGGRRPVTP